MKLWLCLVFVLLFSALVVSQERPADNHHDRPGGHKGGNKGGHNGNNQGEGHHRPGGHHRGTPGPERPNRPTQGPTQDPAQDSSSSDSDSSDPVMCMMLAISCPDGSYAKQIVDNGDCIYVCGAMPIGRVPHGVVKDLRQNFAASYNAIVKSTRVTTIRKVQPEMKLTSNESYHDFCIEATVASGTTTYDMPSVYFGVRVFYVVDTDSSDSKMCPDGISVGRCRDHKRKHSEDIDAMLMYSLSLAFFLIVVSACCCCARRRGRKQACKKTPESTSAAYPADQYELLVNQEPSDSVMPEIHMPPPDVMMTPTMMYPPMPPVPPHLMMPNGMYPVMMQGPDGMWYPVIPQQQEDQI